MNKKNCFKCNRLLEPGAVRCPCGAILDAVDSQPSIGTARADSMESIEVFSDHKSTHTGLENHDDVVAAEGMSQRFETIRPVSDGDEPEDSGQAATSKSDHAIKAASSSPSTDTASKGGKGSSPKGLSPSPIEITPRSPSGQPMTSSESIFLRISERSVALANNFDEKDEADIADYLLKSQVGEGSFGYVYHAYQSVLNRPVAIKQLKPSRLIDTSMLSDKKKQEAVLRNRRTIRKFFFEAEINGRLDYPNIPAIFELGHSTTNINGSGEKGGGGSKANSPESQSTEGFGYFYSMKLIEGEDWETSIARRTREENLEIFEVIAKAVAYAHEEGFIHRDLKPENVMIGKYDEIFLTDWGMAYDLRSKAEIHAGGSPEFMAPEATRSYRADEASEIDERSDIYSLGAILYRIVAKQPSKLFRKGLTMAELFDAIRTTPIRATDSKDPLMPVVMKAMATNPKDRFPSVKAMLAAIETVNQHQESLRITERTKETFKLAVDQRDYNLFNEAIFGFKDAISRWPENTQAVEDLRRARYAYGECAYDKGDYDLVLQTLDRSVADEETLYRSAQNAQTAVQNRASRFRLLRNAFILTLIASSGLMGWLAIKATKAEKTAKDNAFIAMKNEDEAKKQAAIAEIEKKKANEQTAIAEIETNKAITNSFWADVNKTEAQVQRDNAQTQEALANKQKDLAEKNAKTARDQLAKSTFASDLQQLESAYLGATQFNYIQANQLLKKLENPDPSVTVGAKTDSIGESLLLFEQGRPSLDNWALRRVKLISNNDLQKLDFGKNVQSIDYSTKAGIGIVVYKDGALGRFNSIKDPSGVEKWSLPQEILFDQQPTWAFKKVSISPVGKEAVLLASNKQGDDRGALFLLDLSDPASRPRVVSELGNQSYEQASYDPTGEILLAGISNGFALRDRSGRWISQSIAKENPDQTDAAMAKVLAGIRGNLVDLCWEPSGNSAYVIVQNSQGGQLSTVNDIVKVSGFKTGVLSTRTIDVPQDIRSSAESIAWLPWAILVGHKDGRLGAYSLSEEVASEQRGEPKLLLKEIGGAPSNFHKRSIKEIVVLAPDAFKDSRGRNFEHRWIATRSDESAGHLWRVDTKGLTHETAFGCSMGPDSIDSSISQLSILDGSRAFLIDASGQAVVSDLARVSQRNKITRTDASGKIARRPIVDIHMRGDSSQAIAVHADGVVDLWNTQTGESATFNEDRWESYFGHTTGARWFGTAVDSQAGVILTARVSNAMPTESYEGQERGPEQLEICVWDLSSKQIRTSWSVAKGKLDQPIISILGHGHFMLSGDELRIFDYAGNNVTGSLGISQPNVHFAVPNPVYPNVLAMTKIRGDYSGVAWIWQRDPITGKTTRWFEEEKNQTPDNFIQGRPLEGVWSSDGLRFYLLDDLGQVSQLILDSPESAFSVNSLGAKFSLETKDGKSLQRRLIAGTQRDSVDIKVDTRDGVDYLEILVRDYQRRNGGLSEPSSDLYAFDLPVKDSVANRAISRQDRRTVLGLAWLDESVAKSLYPGESGLRVPQEIRPRSVQSIDRQLLVSTSANEVYIRESDNSGRVKVLGRRPIVSSACDWAGNKLFTLHSDGSIWQLSLANLKESKWVRYDYEIAPGREVDRKNFRLLSTPKGDGLWIHDLSQNRLQMISEGRGELIQTELSDVKAIVWHNGRENRGAIVYKDGTIELFEGTPKGRPAQPQDPVRALLGESEEIDECDFFTEKLDRADGGPTIKEYLMVRTVRLADKGSMVRFHFVPIGGANKKENEKATANSYFIWPKATESQTKEGISKAAVSMKDSTIITADIQGGLQVWYAAPSYDLMLPVFPIPAEQDGEILEMCFSRDGKTFVTSDNKGRLVGWMAEDQTQASKSINE